jgi:Spy/CpxP family protein refolding chaperone
MAAIAAFGLAAAHAAAPYSGQESRDIKALSPEEVDSLLAGKGMGFAKAAELNGYPGPLHVLELARELGLTDAQRRETQALFAAMQAKAKALGRELVDEERRLDGLFGEKKATPEAIAAVLRRIGELQAKLRASHLEAHLAQARILTPAQNERYSRLRGYRDAAGGASGHRPDHKGH